MIFRTCNASGFAGHQRPGHCYASHARIARSGHATSLKPTCSSRSSSGSGSSSSGNGNVCRLFTQEDVAVVKRLHRFAKYEGKPVFGSDLAGVEEMLDFAAAGRSGVLGIVACSTTDSSDLVGCVSAQLEPGEGASACSSPADQAQLGEHVSALSPCRAQSGTSKLVLLSLVVRADQRSRGVGAALIQELRRTARDKLLAGSIETDVAEGNQPAVQFFEAAGFKRTSTNDPGGMLELKLDLL